MTKQARILAYIESNGAHTIPELQHALPKLHYCFGGCNGSKSCNTWWAQMLTKAINKGLLLKTNEGVYYLPSQEKPFEPQQTKLL